MSRSSLLQHSLTAKPAVQDIWRMTMALVGFAFGVRPVKWQDREQ